MSTLKKLKKHASPLSILAAVLYFNSTPHFAYLFPNSPQEPTLIPPLLTTTSLQNSTTPLSNVLNPANLEEIQLQALNTAANTKIRYVPDSGDYWQTPLETEHLLTGDCEDYSIYKLSLALQAGIPPSQLRLLYAKTLAPDTSPLLDHMVLLYYPPTTTPNTDPVDPLVLDNLISTIRPLSKRTDLSPLYSFNTNTLWIGASNTPSTKKISQLRKWTHVINSTPLFQYPSYAQLTPPLQSLQNPSLPLNATIPSTSTGAP